MVIGSSSILSAIAALVAVLGLVWLAGRMARFGGLARRRLHLVRCEDRRVLVLTGGAQDLVIGWLEPGEA